MQNYTDEQKALKDYMAKSKDFAAQAETLEAETPKEKDYSLEKALIAGGSTLLGAAFGGLEGGQLGAKVGLEGMNQISQGEEAQNAKRKREIAQKLAILEKKKAQEKEQLEGTLQAAKLARESENQDLKRRETAAKEQEVGIKRAELGDKKEAERLKLTGEIRDKVTKSKNYEAWVGATTAADEIESVLSRPGASGPEVMAAVTKFAKSLDPTSVVREQEFANAAKSVGGIARLKSIWTTLRSGESVPLEDAKKFAAVARTLADVQNRRYAQFVSNEMQLAKKRGVSVEDLGSDILPYASGPSVAAPEKEDGFNIIPSAKASGSSLEEMSDEELELFIKRGGK